MIKVEDVTKQKIADLQFYTEGPVNDNKGNFYCTTLSGGSILKINQRGDISEWGRSICPNGQIILPDGDHLVCDSKIGAVRRFNASGKFKKNEIEGVCSDIKINAPNDLISDHNGNLYFTDSVRHSGKVFFVGINGEQKMLACDLDYPNGLVLSADEKWLYVAESYKNRVVKIGLKEPGIAMKGPEIHVKLPQHPSGKASDNLPDGMALNEVGELFIAHYGMQVIQRISKQGEVVSSIPTTIRLTSNLCFLNEHTLIVTGGHAEPGPGAIVKLCF